MPQSNTKQIKSLQFQITATTGVIIFGILYIFLVSDNLFSYGNAFVLVIIIVFIIADVNSYRKLHEKKK
jgi:hypothetical protein